MVWPYASRRYNECERAAVLTNPDGAASIGSFYIGGRVPCGVTAHGIPIGPLQFDRLEAAPTARCISPTQGNTGNGIEEV
jgi:hypothetical protein